jgi:hypothetical protein
MKIKAFWIILMVLFLVLTPASTIFASDVNGCLKNCDSQYDSCFNRCSRFKKNRKKTADCRIGCSVGYDDCKAECSSKDTMNKKFSEVDTFINDYLSMNPIGGN